MESQTTTTTTTTTTTVMKKELFVETSPSSSGSTCMSAGRSHHHHHSSSSIPEVYVDVHKKHAAKAWENTQKWRRDENIDNILHTSQPYFSKIKQAYPHIPHGFSKNGYPVIYERPGKMDLKELFHRKECKVPDMLRHMVFFLEYLSNVVSSREEVQSALSNRSSKKKEEEESSSKTSWGFCVVMDLKGVSLSILSGDVVRYLKQANHINNAHYPTCLKGLYLANAPFWLSGAFNAIKRMGVLPKNAKIEVMTSSNQADILQKYIQPDQIPKEYGGSSTIKLGSHPFELDLWDLVQHNNNSNNQQQHVQTAQPPIKSDHESIMPTKNTTVVRETTAIQNPIPKTNHGKQSEVAISSKCMSSKTLYDDDDDENVTNYIQLHSGNKEEKVYQSEEVAHTRKNGEFNVDELSSKHIMDRSSDSDKKKPCFPFCDPWKPDIFQSSHSNILVWTAT